MRKILHLRTVTGKGGGPEKTLLATPQHIGPGYDVRLAYIRPHNDLEYDMPQRAAALGVSLVDIPEFGPVDPRSVLRLAREIRYFKPHLLHAHDYKTDVLSILLGRWFRIPVVTTLHGFVTRGGRLDMYYRIDRLALSRMAHSVAVSQDLFDFLGDIGIPEEKRTLAENGIDTMRYRRTQPPSIGKSAFGLDPGRLTIGAVGRLHPEKGFDYLIRAAHLLLNRGFDFDLVIAGDGPERARLQTLITELGRSDQIRLLGYCSNTFDLFHAMDVFVLSSLREGLPNVLLEAMAMQVPVVSTNVAGIPKLVAHERSGLLVPASDESALVSAIALALGSAELRERLSLEARKTVEERFSFTGRMAKIRSVYDRVLGSSLT